MDNTETKNQALFRIKSQMSWLGWTDAQCLSFYEISLKQPDPSTCEDTAPVYYAYYVLNERTGRRKYGIASEKDFVNTQLENKSYDYRLCYNEPSAKDVIQEWKDDVRHERNWDRYMNR